MSEEEPPQAPPPLYQRTRLAVEQELKPFSLRGGVVATYLPLVLFAACAGGAYYMGFVRDVPLSAPQFLAPAAGAVYFLLRFFLTAWPKVGQGGR